MAESAEKVVASPITNDEKKEKKSKKEKKEAEPEPTFYIPEDIRKSSYEEMKHLFDLSIKKKSRKRSANLNNNMGADGNSRRCSH